MFIHCLLRRAPREGGPVFRLSVRVWVPACAGNSEVEKQGPHPTLSHRERAKSDEKSPRPLGGRGLGEGVIHRPLLACAGKAEKRKQGPLPRLRRYFPQRGKIKDRKSSPFGGSTRAAGVGGPRAAPTSGSHRETGKSPWWRGAKRSRPMGAEPRPDALPSALICGRRRRGVRRPGLAAHRP